jgi:hypothetical protein
VLVQLRVRLRVEQLPEEALEVGVGVLGGQHRHGVAPHAEALVDPDALHEQRHHVDRVLAAPAALAGDGVDGEQPHLALRVAQQRDQRLERLRIGVAVQPDGAPAPHLPVRVAEPLADRVARGDADRDELGEGLPALAGVRCEPRDELARVGLRVGMAHGILRRAPECRRARRSLHKIRPTSPGAGQAERPDGVSAGRLPADHGSRVRGWPRRSTRSRPGEGWRPRGATRGGRGSQSRRTLSSKPPG